MLEGRKVNLRLYREEDLEDVLKLNSRVIHRGEFFPVSISSLAESKKQLGETGWWEDDAGRMLITDKQDRIVGTIFFFKGGFAGMGYEIGYSIFDPDNRGKGYVSEALSIFSAYLFEAKDTPRLAIHVAKGNAHSRHVAEKCGYQYEGTCRSAHFLRGEYVDVELFSLLREECSALSDMLAG